MDILIRQFTGTVHTIHKTTLDVSFDFYIKITVVILPKLTVVIVLLIILN